ncbi:MAG TPA: transcription termination factor Rho [Actinomycetota bacterium]
MDTTTDRSALEQKLIPELQRIAQEMGIEGTQRLRKAGLIDAIVAKGGNGSSSAGSTATGSEPRPARARRNGGERAAVESKPGSDAAPEEGAATDRQTPTRESTLEEPPTDAAGTDDTSSTGGRQGDAQPERGARDRQGQGDQNRGQQGRGDRGDQNRGQQGQGDQNRGQQGQGGDRNSNRRQRPSREDRRRTREERRAREEQERAEEMLTAPSQTGILDLLPDGYGFMRTSGYTPGTEDIYVSLSQVRKAALRKGDVIVGKVRKARESEKYWALLEVETVNGLDPEAAKVRPTFDKLTPLFPEERFRLENAPLGVTERIIDMVAPVGKGQRGMVVSPPKAGKTTILKQIANGIVASNPEVHLIVLLVDERPEEVTDWQRTVSAAEVVYSTFDKPTDQHVQVTELVLERAKRLAEQGQDVAIILDSLTRLARAYNLSMPTSGKILSGGIDSAALYPPRRFFGAARNIEEGGSLTIIASALVETGSRMDEGIFEEFKGTGNMEIRLDRQLAEKRLFPAINVDASSTRKEELLLPAEELAQVIKLRRVLHALDPGAALELLTDKIRATKSNEQFLKEIAKTGG